MGALDYGLVKYVHVSTVLVSYALFFLRGIWMMHDSVQLSRRWVRVLPHVNDTVLLAAGVAMATMLGANPASQAWLAAKLIALVVYIALGMLALHPGRPKAVRVSAWLSAQAVFLYVVAVAHTRDPLPF